MDPASFKSYSYLGSGKNGARAFEPEPKLNSEPVSILKGDTFGNKFWIWRQNNADQLLAETTFAFKIVFKILWGALFAQSCPSGCCHQSQQQLENINGSNISGEEVTENKNLSKRKIFVPHSTTTNSSNRRYRDKNVDYPEPEMPILFQVK